MYQSECRLFLLVVRLILTGSLGLTSKGGSVELSYTEYNGEALSRPLKNVDLWEEED